MRMRFAVYENGPAVYLDKGMWDELERLWGVSPRLTIDVHRNLVRVLHDAEHGCTPTICSENETADWIIRYYDRTSPHPIRCGVHELSFHQDLGCLEADLSDPHARPWPYYHEYDDGDFKKHAAVVRDIDLRQDSLEEQTGHRRLPLPKHVQLILTAKERVRYFEEFVV